MRVFLCVCLILACTGSGVHARAAERFGLCPPTYYPGLGVLFTDAVAGDVARLGCGWIRLPFYDEGGAVNLAAYDEIVARANSHGIKVLGLVVLDPFAWDRESPGFRDAFRARCELLSSRYGGGVDAWELWNEPEQAVTRISPESFGALIAEAYDAVKARDPDSVVMPGGIAWPDPYLQQFYDSPAVAAYRAAHSRCPFDVVAVHPYDWSADPAYYLDGYLSSVRTALTASSDGARPVWITEVGWNTAAGQRDSVGGDPSPFGWNEHAQALHIRNLYAAACRIANLGPVFYYARDDYALEHSLGWFGLRRYDSSPKPAWFAYSESARGTAGPPQAANGGFESGDTADWAVFGTVDGVISGPWFAGIVPRSGRFFLGSAVNLPGPGGGKNGGVIQRVPVAPDESYELSAVVWTYQQGGSAPDAACRVGIDPDGGTDHQSTAIVWSPFASSEGGWSPVNVRARAGSPHISVFVEFRQAAPVWNVTAVDDVLLRVVASGAPAELKRLVEGALVACGGCVVTAAGLDGPSFYAQARDRSSGVRVLSDARVEPGDVVDVEGRTAFFERERAVAADTVRVTGQAPLEPLGVPTRGVGGGAVVGLDGLWVAQPEVVGGIGLSNVGLLVRVWGRATYVDSAGEFYYVDDGANRLDGAGCGFGVRVVGGGTPPSIGDSIAASGVVSCFEDGSGAVCPCILVSPAVP